MWYQQWAGAGGFPSDAADRVAATGAVPEITWEPWNAADGTTQPAYSLSAIAFGQQDAYIRSWATSIARWGKPLRLRFAHEMNGSWYPWAEGVNGNATGSYSAAWRHVHDLFVASGARNVIWVWSPNVSYPGSMGLTGLFPGDSYVDEVALDGYNWSTLQAGTTWQSFAQIFQPSLDELHAITARPASIGEVASTEVGGDKAQWITDMFTTLKATPAIRGFTWFDFAKETDWRVDSSAASAAAFRAGLAAVYAG
jgi:beta-mannanase